MFDVKSYFRANKTIPSTIPVGGTIVDGISDVQGRQVTYPYQVRDLHQSAYATLNSNNETTLFAAPASTFSDLVHISCANTSTGVSHVDIRCGTGGSVVKTITMPANSTVEEDLLSPLPMHEAAQTWTVKYNTTVMGSDLSNTSTFVSASFVQNQ